MNPNATSFKPSMQQNLSVTRSHQITFLCEQIVCAKEERDRENINLHALHDRMQSIYQFLSTETKRINRKDPGSISRRKHAEIIAGYKTLSAEYKMQTAKVSDISAKIMTMEQKYTKLQMSVSSLSPPSSPKRGTKRKRKSLFSGKINYCELDGIEVRRKHEMLVNSLPAIIETDYDSLGWEQCCGSDSEHKLEFGSAKSVKSPSDEKVKPMQPQAVDTQSSIGVYTENIQSSESEQVYQSVGPNAKELMMENESPEPVTVDNEEIDYCSPRANDKSVDILQHHLNATYCVTPSPSKRSLSPEPNSKELDLEELKEEMADILEMATYGKTSTIQEALRKSLTAKAVNVESVRIVVDCIIEVAVSCKPRLYTVFAKKIGSIFWTVQNYCESVCNHKIEWNWSDEALGEMMNLDLFELLRQQLRSTFDALQVGDDAQKFVNIMVLMAELYNERLLCSSTLVEVMESILCERHLNRVGKSDIEGLYEIFKRSSKGLRHSNSRKDIEYYLSVLQRVSSWSRPQERKKYRSIPFMIKKMENCFYH